MALINVAHRLEGPAALLGVVRAEGVAAAHPPPGFAEGLAALLAAPPAEEARRQAVRALLRHGRYRPTGRGKPASEYLLRAAEEGIFPRINAPVDACNYVSLRHGLPISLWDLDRAAAARFEVRHGRPGESYVFNAGGQTIDVEDLIVGCVLEEGGSRPIVNPVKDSLATKTTEATTRVAALLYAPAALEAALQAATAELAALLAGCGPAAEVRHAVLPPGAEAAV